MLDDNFSASLLPFAGFFHPIIFAHVQPCSYDDASNASAQLKFRLVEGMIRLKDISTVSLRSTFPKLVRFSYNFFEVDKKALKQILMIVNVLFW